MFACSFRNQHYGMLTLKLPSKTGKKHKVKIHPQSGWIFTFSGIALVYRLRTSAFSLGLPATHCLLATRKLVARIEYAQLICFSVCFQLICNILLYRFRVLPYRSHR